MIQSDFTYEQTTRAAAGRTGWRGGVGREEKKHRELAMVYASDDNGLNQRLKGHIFAIICGKSQRLDSSPCIWGDVTTVNSLTGK